MAVLDSYACASAMEFQVNGCPMPRCLVHTAEAATAGQEDDEEADDDEAELDEDHIKPLGDDKGVKVRSKHDRPSNRRGEGHPPLVSAGSQEEEEEPGRP
jgi:hypothetical protein